ncbi:MAG: PIG-L family deacetylase [Chloroflexi bacterium]|nr:PIG-L family deacetylase [Chloroflexota bacterium]
MAGTVARWTASGKEVVYVVVTRGEAGSEAPATTVAEVGAAREAEQRAAAAVVGVKQVEFLGFPDSQLYYGPDLRKAIARTIRRYRPDVLVTTNFEMTWEGGVLNQADHRHVGLAVVDARLDASLRAAFPELLAEGLPPWRGVKRLLVAAPPDPDCLVDVGSTIELAVQSLAEHRSYLEELGLDADWTVRGRASAIGERHGLEYAETFRIYSFD